MLMLAVQQQRQLHQGGAGSCFSRRLNCFAHTISSLLTASHATYLRQRAHTVFIDLEQ